MSKARLVITAVTREHVSQAEAARRYGVSPGWVSKLMTRWRAEGEAAYEPRSRRPHSIPTATAEETVELVLALRARLTREGLDAGADTIAWHLRTHHGTQLARATINRILARAGARTPQPKKRPKSSYIRFQAAQPNETWQSDFTHYRLADGTDTEIITWIDDCTRYALHISAHQAITARIVRDSFRTAAARHGLPASTLTDNGMVYTVRLAGIGRAGGRTMLENELRRHGITQKNTRPGHPTTSGKVERFQQTMKNWLRAQPQQPATLTELQQQIDRFAEEYNQRRPHRSLPHHATPAALYDTLPKATPTRDRSPDTHDRVRTDRISDNGAVTVRINGKLHHIGIGRPHARTHVLLLIEDLNIRVINATTGELLRELTLNPDTDYQPLRR